MNFQHSCSWHFRIFSCRYNRKS